MKTLVFKNLNIIVPNTFYLGKTNINFKIIYIEQISEIN